ncbi:MAG: hypothetical protein Kow0042_17040 [Calditrichia bacterium]
MSVMVFYELADLHRYHSRLPFLFNHPVSLSCSKKFHKIKGNIDSNKTGNGNFSLRNNFDIE